VFGGSALDVFDSNLNLRLISYWNQTSISGSLPDWKILPSSLFLVARRAMEHSLPGATNLSLVCKLTLAIAFDSFTACYAL
jgi:hypothetical protein